MESWKELFEELKYQLPKKPDSTNFDSARSQIHGVLEYLYQVQSGPLLTNNEPKIIIKRDATPFQKSKFGENYTFVYQSLLTGRESQFIPYKERDTLGVKEEYKQTGGNYPYAMNISNNIKIVQEYYFAINNRIWNEYYTLFNEYLKIVHMLKSEWWDVYSEYTKSEEWKSKREQRLIIDNYSCVICASTEILQVHHMHYDNTGDEKMSDLITVCKSCHQKLHPYKSL